MKNAHVLVGNEDHDNSSYAFAKADDVYVVFLAEGGTATLALSGASGTFRVRWFDTRNGGALQAGSVDTVAAGGRRSLGAAPSDAKNDWVVLVRK